MLFVKSITNKEDEDDDDDDEDEEFMFTYKVSDFQDSLKTQVFFQSQWNSSYSSYIYTHIIQQHKYITHTN